MLFGACTEKEDHSALRDTIDAAGVDLIETVSRAESSLDQGNAVEARLVRADGQYSITAFAGGTRHTIRADLGGNILAIADAGSAGNGCGSLSLSEALAIAAAEAGGDVVAVVPDDDDPCMREIQVLVDVTLWEVKVGSDGSVVELELSDEVL
jgi:hypothetical protein